MTAAGAADEVVVVVVVVVVVAMDRDVDARDVDVLGPAVGAGSS